MTSPPESAVQPSEFRPSKEGSDSADIGTGRNRPNRTDSEIRTAPDQSPETTNETPSQTTSGPLDPAAEPTISDLGPGKDSLTFRERRLLRRRLLRSANLKTLRGIVDMSARLIVETVSGAVSPRNGDVLSRMLGRHAEILDRARQDEAREETLAELRRLDALPAGLADRVRLLLPPEEGQRRELEPGPAENGRDDL